MSIMLVMKSLEKRIKSLFRCELADQIDDLSRDQMKNQSMKKLESVFWKTPTHSWFHFEDLYREVKKLKL